MNIYDVGDVARCLGEFTDTATKTHVAPPSVTAKVWRPDGTLAFTGAAIPATDLGAGWYSAAVTIDNFPGVWTYEMTSSAPNAGSATGSFRVRKRRFA